VTKIGLLETFGFDQFIREREQAALSLAGG
jgi:hypothetical protein